jgi:MoaA/NifB/PqqE/SkfB family radical SAM enzyme
LLGGEPLLHPQITSIFDIINLNFDSYTAAVVTNGILLNKQSPIFWESCRKNAIEIIITKYPINLNFDFLKDIAEKYGVKIKFWGNTETTIQTMQRVPLDLKGKQNYIRSFKICSISNGCITLKEGKLFTCSLVPHINHFNEYFNQNLQVTKDDYIDIDKAKNIKEILEFLSKPIPFCRYCNIGKKTGFIKWSISKKDIKEWT